MKFQLVLTLIVICYSSQIAGAVEVSCDQNAVQSAIGAAESGETIAIKEGDCVWDSAKTVLVDLGDTPERKITIKGAGKDKTIIRHSKTAFSLNAREGQGFSLSNLRIVAGDSTGYWQGMINVNGGSKAWRIHDIQLDSGPGNSAYILVSGNTYGLIDNSVFAGSRSAPIKIDGDDFPAWKRPQNWGDLNAVYIEHNTFHTTPLNPVVAHGVTDCERGGRYVFRYNTHYNTVIQGHGFDSGGASSCMSAEVYGNKGFVYTQDATKALAWSWLGQILGGATMWFDNTWELTPYSSISTNPSVNKGVWLTSKLALKISRAEGTPSSWGACDNTTNYKICSNVDRNWNRLYGSDRPKSCTSDSMCTRANHGGTQDTQCVWQFCSNNRMLLCNPLNGNANCRVNGVDWGTCTAYMDTPTECFQQPTRSTHNLPKPAYEWNNSCVGAQSAACSGGLGASNVHFVGNSLLIENRDFYNMTTNFTGEAGVGRGLLANRPATCTPATAYWATDTKILYQCSAPNTWTEYYRPLVDPHPLAQGG